MTSGVSGNSVYRFIKYLSESGSTAEQVFGDADINGNGCTKTELKNYLNDLNLDYLDGSDSKAIFAAFNTNTSGKVEGFKTKNKNVLTLDEAEKAAEYIEKYETVNALLDAVLGGSTFSQTCSDGTVIETSVVIPQDLLPYVSRSSVEESLMNSFDKTMNIANIDKILSKAIAKSGADGYAREKISEVISGNQASLPQGYTVADDDLQGLIDSYIKSLNGDSLASIKNCVDAIIDAYFSTIGIGNPVDLATAVDGINLSRFGWSPSKGFNDLQLKKITEQVSSSINVAALGIDMTNSQNKKLFEQAVSEFITEQFSGQTDYDQVLSQIGSLSQQDFLDSKAGQAFIIMTKYADFNDSTVNPNDDINNAYYDALVSAFGQDFADGLSRADSTYGEGELYNNILRQVANMVKNGEIELSDVANKIIELIGQNYEQFVNDLGLDISGGVPVDTLYTNFINLYSNDDASLSALKTSAINFLNSAYAIGNSELNTVIKQNFGDDYKARIQSLRDKVNIERGVTAVKGKYDELCDNNAIIDVEQLTCTWNVTEPSLRVGGSAVTVPCSATINNGNEVFTGSISYPITYGVVTNSGVDATVAINQSTGELSVTPGTQDGTLYIQVKVMVGDVQVGTKDICLTVEKKPVFNAGVLSTGGVKIPVGGDDLGWSKSKAGAIGSFKAYAEQCKAQAIRCGFDEATAENAKNTLISYFTSAMNALDSALDKNLTSKFNENKGDAFTYHNYATGEDVSCSDQSTVKAVREAKNVNDYADLTGTSSGTGIYIGVDITNNDDYWVYVNGSVMLNLFKNFLG